MGNQNKNRGAAGRPCIYYITDSLLIDGKIEEYIITEICDMLK